VFSAGASATPTDAAPSRVLVNEVLRLVVDPVPDAFTNTSCIAMGDL